MMFTGLRARSAAMARLTNSINRSADFFDQANEQLAQRLGFDESERA